MINGVIELEELRLQDINDLSDSLARHERHRIFPSVFENRDLSNILDVAAGVGVVGKRIQADYKVDILCNDICPKCLQTLEKRGLKTISFDIDDMEKPFPFADGHFDAVIALSTIEHLINIDHFIVEISRILREGGYLYISAPNYSGLTYLLPFLMSGKTFHDPLSDLSRYEFYAHVRYFTYQTLLEYIHSYNFTADTVYLPLPESSSRYLALRQKSILKATLFRTAMKFIYRLSPRWNAEPVICFQKSGKNTKGAIRNVIM